jgi:hypothetical protein
MDFLEKFELLSSTREYHKSFEKGIVKHCKFCGKSSEETDFKNIPHVLPELFGKNSYTSNDECDSCNELFGKFESDLANFVSPYLTILGLKTKKKIPTFQSRKGEGESSTLIKSKEGKPHFDFRNNLSEFQYDYDNQKVNVFVKKKKFIPINVFRGLVKVGLSLCPIDELKLYRKTIKWLSQEKSNSQDFIPDIPLLLYRTRLANKFHQKPSAQLYKRKSEIKDGTYRPRHCLVVYSGVLVLQIFIPFSTETEDLNKGAHRLEYDLFPAFMFDYEFSDEKKQTVVNLSSLPIVQYNMDFHGGVEENELISFTYDKIIRG